ncbi:MAG TPA: VOC family protein [Solirubrobacteraceae bacterium]|jgi:catechol 2,3-dioxygenase|nr:VOC family protein [Solirubrobacteraceae bacterium]
MTDLPSSALDSETSPAAIAAGTSMGTVSLTVSDLARSRAFYEAALGLVVREVEDGDLLFGVPGEPALIRLHGDPSAPPLDRRATGLFHLAVLLPSRRDLAHALGRLAQARWPLDGVSDHLVSEALYLSDPDGNGIELYRDRPREQWRHDGGELQMATLPLDLRDLAGELSGSQQSQPTAPEGTVMGHVHLQVADIPEAEAFYRGILGFGVTTRGYPGALFVSAGGYHHHLGLNTWHSAGSGPAAPGAIGLRAYEVRLPDAAELDRVIGRVRAAGQETVAAGTGITAVRDPSGNVVHLRSR